MLMYNDTIIIFFALLKIFNISVSVSLSKSYPGGTAIRIPGTEWYLEAFTQIVE